MPLTAGSRLGHFEITGLLGRGGMGEVLRARDTRLNREVAIKVLPDLFLADPDRVARFTREAQTLAALNHPNIAHIHGLEESPSTGSGQEGSVRALVLELVEGDDLAVILARGSMASSEALDIARQLADALESAHELGIVHRDLKPANIKVRPDGTVKVLDFGLAKALDPFDGGAAQAGSGAALLSPAQAPTFSARATQMGVVLGTAAYMAPEQAKGKPVDRRADIWAFGVILYEMLTGRRLFDSDTIAETLAQVITRDVDLAALPPSTPSHVRALIARCLVKDPKQRLRDMGEARLALSATGAPMTLPGDAAAGLASSRAPSRREMTAWTLAAASLVAAGLVWWPRGAAPAEAPAIRAAISLGVPVALGRLGVALAPDGHAMVVQARWQSGDTRLYLRDMRSGSLEPLPGTDYAVMPFWSPDSRAIAFVTRAELKRLDLQSGTIRTLCAAPQLALSGAWGPDGTILFGGVGGALSRVSAEGGAPAVLASEPGEVQERPVFLPDGGRFLYYSRLANGSTRLRLARLDDDRRADLPGDGARPVWSDGRWLLFKRGHALYAQEADLERPALLGEPVMLAADLDTATWSGIRESVSGTGLVGYISAGDLRRQFRWYARDGRPAADVGPAGEYTTFSLSRDGRRIVAARRNAGASHLWTIDAVQGTSAPLTVGDVFDVDPRWSPDGRTVLFGSMRDPVRSPFRLAPGESPALAWRFDGRMFALDDWSPDGRWVIHHDATVPTLLARRFDSRAAPGEPREETLVVARALTGMIDQGAMSPDGRWVAYNANESGRYEVFVVPFPPAGDRVQVSREGGVQPMWRGDGRELYYMALDGTPMAVPMPADLLSSAPAAAPLFKPRVQVIAGEIEQYAPSPDGSRFLVLDFAGVERPQEVTLLTNWRALVKR